MGLRYPLLSNLACCDFDRTIHLWQVSIMGIGLAAIIIQGSILAGGFETVLSISEAGQRLTLAT